MLLFYVHAFLSVVGALVGMFMLKMLDEGIWDASLLKGAMLPNPTPSERLFFVAMCALVPEIAIAGCLALFLFARGDERMKPECWSCGSNDVRVVFAGYRTACCKKGCTEDHEHSEEIPHANMECRTCGNQWSDGSGDFADIAGLA